MNNKVYIDKFEAIPTVAQIVKAMEWIEWDKILSTHSRVFIKPNLTWKEPMPGVTVSPKFLEALIQAFSAKTKHISIVESNGGYHSFQAEEAFQSHGLYSLREKYGINVYNLSKLPAENYTCIVNSEEITVKLPSILLNECDVFITVPVPKVHAMTKVSLGFKNQWGCIPETMRLHNHPQFAQKIIAINKLLKPQIVIFDGTYFLDKTGPMIGEAVKMNLLICSNDIGAGSLACCEIMGVDPSSVKHLRLAKREKMFPNSVSELNCNVDPKMFWVKDFTLERSLLQWFTLAAFNSSFITNLFYDSVFSGPMHNCLYKIRKNRLVAKLLYRYLDRVPSE